MDDNAQSLISCSREHQWNPRISGGVVTATWRPPETQPPSPPRRTQQIAAPTDQAQASDVIIRADFTEPSPTAVTSTSPDVPEEVVEEMQPAVQPEERVIREPAPQRYRSTPNPLLSKIERAGRPLSPLEHGFVVALALYAIGALGKSLSAQFRLFGRWRQ